ncbi:MAG: hypothetical protein AAFW98_09620 [Pseudomonadota bacterium]
MAITLPVRALAIGAVVSFAALAALPATAQDEDCPAGAFGEWADFDVSEGDDDAISQLSLEFQCGDTLSDRTFIPTGYRLYLDGACGGASCEYETVLALPTARDNQYEANFVLGGNNVTARLRKGRRGTTLIMITRPPKRGAERQRSTYRLTPQKED